MTSWFTILLSQANYETTAKPKVLRLPGVSVEGLAWKVAQVAIFLPVFKQLHRLGDMGNWVSEVELLRIDSRPHSST